MPDFDYAGTEFSFKTVFYLDTVFSYRICLCGFEHEYLDYISDSRTIEKEKFERVMKCITDGECPHVSKVPETYVKETKIYGIHIAVAVGTIEALADSLRRQPIRYGSLYQLGCYELALLKNCEDDATMSIVRQCFREEEEYILPGVGIVIRSDDNPDLVTLQEEDVLDYLAKKSVQVLEPYLTNSYDSEAVHASEADVFRIALQLNHEEILHGIADKAMGDFEKLLSLLDVGGIWVCYYDKSDILDRLLFAMQQLLKYEEEKCLVTSLNFTCHVLHSQQCKKVLLERSPNFTQSGFTISTQDKVKTLFDLLLLRPPIFKDKVKQALNTIPNLYEVMKSAKPDGQWWKYIQDYHTLFLDSKDLEVLRMILSCKLNVNGINANGLTSLTELLQAHVGCYPYRDEGCEILAIRHTAELYLYENPDIEINAAAVEKAVEADEQWYKLEDYFTDEFRLSGVYKMDVQKHSLFGHDDPYDFALNFMVPMLLECGFSLTDKVRELLTVKTVHPDEREYIRRCANDPRSLKVSCRDSLRTYFGGRQIHKFLEQSKIPKSVKDFILLKPLFKCIPDELLK